MNLTQHRQEGAVSLFVVIFSALLMIIITVSFVQLMLKDQRQATASDLSQSAYDSAQSGVEDAKRLLLLEQSCQGDNSPSCNAARAAVDSGACDTVARGLYNDPSSTETMVQQSQGDKDLQQAYTCVKILADTTDYKGVVDLNQSNIVPLRGTRAFTSISISWFTRADISSTTNAMTIGFPSNGPSVKLPQPGSTGAIRWDNNYPSLLRAQLMQTGSSFKLADFDDGQAGSKSNANTLFLYPSTTGAAAMSFDLDGRRDPLNAPHPAKCVASFNASEYSCTVKIDVPTPTTGSINTRNAFLRLSALYNGSHYKVELMDAAGTLVPFDRVQPEVDSTGRANDMFRRVKTRVEFKSDFIYPEAAVDIGDDLCKNFIVTDQDSDYVNSFSCTP
jgi:Tfp pilus assembly protein PilX